jgi:hypothetical protein
MQFCVVYSRVTLGIGAYDMHFMFLYLYQRAVKPELVP